MTAANQLGIVAALGNTGAAMTKEIELTQGYKAIVDESDYEWLNSRKWFVFKPRSSRTQYAMTHGHGKDEPKTVLMHRLIMGNPIGCEVDHRDGDGLNCTRRNLRLASHIQNSWNRPLSAKNTSGVTGVSWIEERKKWLAQIRVNYKMMNLGRFDHFEDAVAAREAAEHRHYGEFARAA